LGLVVLLLSAVGASAVRGAGVQAEATRTLDGDYWRWRAREQPFSSDDIPRIERPPDFHVDWTLATIERRLAELADFERRWRALAPTDAANGAAGANLRDAVDYRLLGSAIARARWELSVEQTWKRDPMFYVDQTLGSVYALLLPAPPFGAARQAQIIARMQGIPATIRAAEQNLTDLRAPFATLAIDALDRLRERTQRMQAALAPELSPSSAAALRRATPAALAALEQYRAWLQGRLPGARADTAIGRAGYHYFLSNVALLPYTPEQLLAISRQEWARSMAFEAYAQARLAGVPPPRMFATADEQIAAERAAEQRIRRFLVEAKILTVPADLPHYRNLLMPDYIAAWSDLGEADDFTGPSRLAEDGVSYIPAPGPNLGFFNLSRARDPRPIIVHEGVPGHYFQLSLGWRNPDPIRRHYYDSGANEGIGFYAEEMMLQAGLVDDDANTRATLYSFMRLRALRVEVDVRLALGEFTLGQAADYLERTVPMDHASALAEAALFASTPGQAISYQIGKIQITELLADTRRAQGNQFSALQFNDFVWNNGNVPLSLQRWELLGDPSALPPPEVLPAGE